MGMYKYLRQMWEKPKKNNANYKSNIFHWRRDNVITRIDAPTRPDRAHALGYKAKPGVAVARVRIVKGSRKRPRWTSGRKPSKMGQYKYTTAKADQVLAEEKANRKYTNLEVANSYWVAEDGQYKWFEVIMVDPQNPHVKSDKKLKELASRRGRAHRGLTAAGRESRGIGRGKGFE